MPGYCGCDIIDANNSRWTLRVGVGGLLRTVVVNVHVERWAGPGEVDFTYALEGDPVGGGGTYRAAALLPSVTQVSLAVRVEGSGPMASMWEALGKPLLPQFARAFANQLKERIESGDGASVPGLAAKRARAASAGTGHPSILRRVGLLLKAIWASLTARSSPR
jgi:hypothetical protein